MNSAKLDELEKVARGATPGPWHVHCPAIYPYIRAEDGAYIIDHNGQHAYARTHADAAYIAAASPDTILEMVRELRVLERALEIAASETDDKSKTQTVVDWRSQAEREGREK